MWADGEPEASLVELQSPFSHVILDRAKQPSEGERRHEPENREHRLYLPALRPAGTAADQRQFSGSLSLLPLFPPRGRRGGGQDERLPRGDGAGGVLFHSKKGYQIRYRCQKCGHEQVNKIAQDTVQPDDMDRICSLMKNV